MIKVLKKQGEIITSTTDKQIILLGGYVAVQYEFFSGDEAVCFVLGGEYILDKQYVYKCLSDVEIGIASGYKTERSYLHIVEEFNKIKEIDVKKRILHFLYVCFVSYGKTVGNKQELPFEISHEAIASGVASTRVTVTRALKEFEARGWLIKGRRQCMQLTLTGLLYCQSTFS